MLCRLPRPYSVLLFGRLFSFCFDSYVPMNRSHCPGTVELAFYQYDPLSRRNSLRFNGSTADTVAYTYEPDSDLDVLTNALNATTTVTLVKLAAGKVFYLKLAPGKSSPVLCVRDGFAGAERFGQGFGVALAANRHHSVGDMVWRQVNGGGQFLGVIAAHAMREEAIQMGLQGQLCPSRAGVEGVKAVGMFAVRAGDSGF